MTANGRGTMRPGGRSPPFLAIGLFVALVILGFNYWSLSARNGEQANEIVLMESELRLVNAKKTSAEKRSEAISDKVSDLEKQLNEQREAYANKVAELGNVEKEKETFANRIKELEVEIAKCRDESLPKCEQEKNDVAAQVQELKDKVEFHKNKPCEESACQAHIQRSRDVTLEDIYKVAGAGPLISLYKADGNLGSYKDQIATLAAKVEHQPLAANQAEQQKAAQEPLVKPKEEQAADQAAQDAQAAAADANKAAGEQDASKVGESNNKPEGQANVTSGEEKEPVTTTKPASRSNNVTSNVDIANEGTEGQRYDEGEGQDDNGEGQRYDEGEGQDDNGEGQREDEGHDQGDDNYDEKVPSDVGKHYDEGNDDDKPADDDTLRVHDDKKLEDTEDYAYDGGNDDDAIDDLDYK